MLLLSASTQCPGRNCDRPPPLKLLSPPPYFFVFGDGYCEMRTFCTRGHREAVPAEKSGKKTLVPRKVDAELVRKVEGAGLVLVLVRM